MHTAMAVYYIHQKYVKKVTDDVRGPIRKFYLFQNILAREDCTGALRQDDVFGGGRAPKSL